MIYRDEITKNDYSKDNRLSLQARGLLSYVFNCKDDTNFNYLKLQEYTKAKRTVVENSIKELVSLGYAKIIKSKDKGKFSSNIDFYEKPKISNTINEPLGYLYVAKMGEYYKIGISKNPTQRLKKFTQLPFMLKTILCECVPNYQEVEKELHEIFNQKRLQGEWFALEEKDIEFIKNYLNKN